jgi:hypothetical protein
MISTNQGPCMPKISALLSRHPRPARLPALILAAWIGLLGLSLTAAFTAVPASAACAALPSGKGTVAMAVNVPSAGTYRVWARELAPSTTANGFYLQIADAGACQVTMGHAATPTATPITSGGGGSTPAPTPTPVILPPSGGTSSTKPAVVSKTISIPVPSGATNVQCFVDSKAVDCASVDTTKLADGNHTVEVKGTDPTGKPLGQKTTVNVKNHLTPLEQLVAGIQKHRWPLILIALALTVLITVGIVVMHHFRPPAHPPATSLGAMPNASYPSDHTTLQP